MERRHAGIRSKMEQVELESASLSQEKLLALNVDASTNDDMLDYLLARTEGDAGTIVRGAENEPSLEIWRRLAHASDPRGTFTELRDTRQVTRPARCGKASDLATHFATWEDRLRRVTNRTGNCPLTAEGKRWAILDLVPSSLEKELENQIHLFRSCDDLKAHALDLAGRQGRNGEAHNIEAELIEFSDESGELFKLERHNGKWVPSKLTKKPFPPKISGTSGTKVT